MAHVWCGAQLMYADHMSTSENPKVRELRGIRDPLERARLSHEFLTNGRHTLDLVQALRDEAIRQARERQKDGTIQEIAVAIGAKKNIVVDALRRRR